jgi:syntaxin 1B/2/3
MKSKVSLLNQSGKRLSTQMSLGINSDLDALQNETSDMMSDIRMRMKKLANETQKARGSDQKARKTQQAALARRMMDIVEAYQKVQVQNKQKYRQRMEREIRIGMPSSLRHSLERYLFAHSSS